ncbi:hypothetical protein IT084_17475, partial [Desulfallas sp. Bu1-1]|nr:hypothetical protein [Desulfallas sp. Bu1-1]
KKVLMVCLSPPTARSAPIFPTVRKGRPGSSKKPRRCSRRPDMVAGLVDRFRGEYDVIDVDGTRVLFGDGWGLVRASNTQPVLVVRC